MVLYCTVPYCTVLYGTVRYCTVLYSSVWFYTVIKTVQNKVQYSKKNIESIKYSMKWNNYRVCKFWVQNGYKILYCTAWFGTGQDSVLWCSISVLYSIVQCCRVLHYCMVLYCTVQHCTVLYSTVWYCTVRYCTVLYGTVWHCTVRYSTVGFLFWLVSLEFLSKKFSGGWWWWWVGGDIAIIVSSSRGPGET